MALYDTFQWVPGQAIESIGSFNYAMTGSERNMAAAAQQQAETADYVKASNVAMREARAQAETSKAKAETMLADFQTSNPELAQQMYETGVMDKVQESLSNISTNKLKHATNLISTVNEQNYPSVYKSINENDPELGSSLPTPEQLAQNPKKKEQLKFMSGMIFKTYADKVAEGMQTSVNDAAMRREIAGNASSERNSRNQIAAQRAMNVEDNTARSEDSRLDRESNERIWDKRGEVSRDVANIREVGRAATAKIKEAANKSGTGKAPKLTDYGPADKQFMFGSAVIDDLIAETDINPPKENLNAFKAKMWAAAQSEYSRQKNAFEGGKQATMPNSPPEIMTELAERYLTDPKAYETGSNLPFMKGNIDVQGGNTSGMNAKQKAIMNDPAFQNLAPAEQKLVLDNAGQQ